MTESPEAELYARLRDYLKHEDSLINWRLTWNFGLQSLLLGGYAYLLRSTVEKGKVELGIDELRRLADLGLPVLGLAIGLASFVGVVAALHSITRLHLMWDAIAREARFDTKRFPAISGGGSDFARRYGCLASLVPTLALWETWAVILAHKVPVAGWATGFVGLAGFAWTLASQPKAPRQLPATSNVNSRIGSTESVETP